MASHVSAVRYQLSLTSETDAAGGGGGGGIIGAGRSSQENFVVYEGGEIFSGGNLEALAVQCVREAV